MIQNTLLCSASAQRKRAVRPLQQCHPQADATLVYLHSGNLTWHLTIPSFDRTYIFKRSIFDCHIFLRVVVKPVVWWLGLVRVRILKNRLPWWCCTMVVLSHCFTPKGPKVKVLSEWRIYCHTSCSILSNPIRITPPSRKELQGPVGIFGLTPGRKHRSDGLVVDAWGYWNTACLYKHAFLGILPIQIVCLQGAPIVKIHSNLSTNSRVYKPIKETHGNLLKSISP